MITRIQYLQIILILFVLIFVSQLNDTFAHEDEGVKQVDDRIYTSITNDSPNQRTGVTFYYTAISHTGHNHQWMGEKGVIICELGTMNPGQSKTCHGPFHSDKSPDNQPECNPSSDWDFTFLISYNEGGNQKSTPSQRGTITRTTGDSGESRHFKWDSHTEQILSDITCSNQETNEPAPMTAPESPNPPNVSLSNPDGENPTIFGTSAKDTNVKIFISEIGFFGFNFFSIYEVEVDESGNWSVNLGEPLENGVYDITAISIDKKTGLFSKPTNGTIAIDRNPPPQEGTCPTEIKETERVPSPPFTPLPRIDGTTDLDPDSSRPDQGKNDCALIAVTNNLNYFVNTHNIPRGNGPNQLPADNSQIIDQLRTDMNWGPNGVLDSDFISGKNTFVHRYGLPITTTTVDFPTPEQIKKALDEGEAIELNFQFRKPGQTLGHTVSVVGISNTSDGVNVQIHDPMTKGQKTQDSYELRRAQDKSGKEFWILMDYPNWNGYTILERMFVQEYGGSNQSTTTLPSNSSTSSGTILDEANPFSIPTWLKNNIGWWGDGKISDQEFVSALEFLIKNKIISSPNISISESDSSEDINSNIKDNSPGNSGISSSLTIPDWIKNNARWWATGKIDSQSFIGGIEFMVENEIIKSPNIQVSKPSKSFGTPSKSEDLPSISHGVDGFTWSKTNSTSSQCEGILGDKNCWMGIKIQWNWDDFKNYYETQKLNEISMDLLLNIKNAEVKILEDSTEKAWEKYSKTKTPEIMEQATEIQQKKDQAHEDTKKALEALKSSKELVAEAESLAKNQGIAINDLNDLVSDQQNEFGQISKIENSNDIDSAIPIAQKISAQAMEDLKRLMIFYGLKNGQNLEYEDVSKVYQLLLSDSFLSKSEIKELVLKTLNTYGPSYFALYFNEKDRIQLYNLFSEDELRLIYFNYIEDEIYDESQGEKGFQKFLNDINYPTPTTLDNPDDSIVPQLSPLIGSGLIPSYNEKIIEGHRIISDLDENWDETKSILNELSDNFGFPENNTNVEANYSESAQPKEPSVTTNPGSDEPLRYVIEVAMINGFAYPSFQFVIVPPYSDCPENWIRPAADKYNTVYHVFFDEVGLTFQGGGCGNFGRISEITGISDYPITESQATFLEEKFGFDDFRDRPYVP